ncbi:MAG: amidohydrolase family protein [Planctomycetota bacterium]
MSAIWDAVRRGEMLSRELLIDCHAHVGPHAEVDSSRGKGSGEDLVRWMDESGVTMAVASHMIAFYASCPAGNDEMARLVDAHRGRIVGSTVVNPRYPEAEMVGELEKHLVKGNHKGIKIHPEVHNYPADGPEYRPMWAFANERELAVLSHTWLGDPTCAPAMFGPIAKDHPRVKVILGHSGGLIEGMEAAIGLARTAQNIYLDLCCSIMPDGIIELMVKEVGAERILFGTDVNSYDGRAKIGQVAAARISDDDKRKIFGLNAKRLFGI